VAEKDEHNRYAVRVAEGKYASASFYGGDVSFRLAKLYIRRADAERRAKRIKGEVVVCAVLADVLE
jgi:hypothetical protein